MTVYVVDQLEIIDINIKTVHHHILCQRLPDLPKPPSVAESRQVVCFHLPIFQHVAKCLHRLFPPTL